MMSWTAFFVTLVVAWALGAVAVFVVHALYLQMVSFDLALIRSLLWPIWITTGWPHGTPMRMD